MLFRSQLDLAHYVFNLTEEFDGRVVDPYVAAYAAGRTPNPCVECNRSIKWGLLLERCRAMGFDALATGHHARVERDDAGRSWIRRGDDPAKDQSYVLSVLPGDAVGDTLLPVGDLTKAEVRERAASLGLRTATKAESMDVCFIRRDERGSFLQDRLPAAPGVVVDVGGAPLGEHDGVAGFTIGQRRGTGVAAGERRYVVDLDAATATVVLGTRADLLRDRIDLVGLAPVHDALPDGSRVLVQTSAHGEPAAATLEGSSVRLDAARPRVAPGQVVALYVGDRVVAGAYAG